MIGHNSRPDCARESVKISSVSDSSKASFEIRCTYVWRHFGRKSVFHFAKNLVVLFKELEQKLNRLEINFYKKCQRSPSLCESNWKKWTIFGWDIFGRLKGKLTLHLSALGQLKGKFSFYCPTKHLKIAQQVSLGVLQHPNQFQENVFGGNKCMEDFAYVQIA